MLSIYLVALIVGSFFMGMSVFAGHHDTDGDMDHDGIPDDVDHDIDGDGIDNDIDHEVDHDMGHDGDHDTHHLGEGNLVGDISWYIPFLSFKFWVFFSMTYGMCGTILTFLKKGEPLIQIISLSVGLSIGYAASYVLKKMKTQTTNSAVSEKDYNGQLATITIPFKSGEKGKISMNIKGNLMEMVAITEDENIEFKDNEKCVILGLKDNLCVISKADDNYLE